MRTIGKVGRCHDEEIEETRKEEGSFGNDFPKLVEVVFELVASGPNYVFLGVRGRMEEKYGRKPKEAVR